MPLKENLRKIKQNIKDVAKEEKEEIYKRASKIEQKIDVGITEAVQKIKGKALEQRREMHESIKEMRESIKEMHGVIEKEGGYKQAAKRAGRAIHDSAEDLLKNLEVKYENFRKEFFINGKFDYKKAGGIFEQKKQTAKRFGKKTLDTLQQMVSDYSPKSQN